jgi:predicted nucleic acid-binding protein
MSATPWAPLLGRAWQRRANVRLVDARYITLADELEAPIITLDSRLAASSPRAELLQIHSDESAETGATES